jgi:hypothetical protein
MDPPAPPQRTTVHVREYHTPSYIEVPVQRLWEFAPLYNFFVMTKLPGETRKTGPHRMTVGGILDMMHDGKYVITDISLLKKSPDGASHPLFDPHAAVRIAPEGKVSKINEWKHSFSRIRSQLTELVIDMDRTMHEGTTPSTLMEYVRAADAPLSQALNFIETLDPKKWNCGACSALNIGATCSICGAARPPGARAGAQAGAGSGAFGGSRSRRRLRLRRSRRSRNSRRSRRAQRSKRSRHSRRR